MSFDNNDMNDKIDSKINCIQKFKTENENKIFFIKNVVRLITLIPCLALIIYTVKVCADLQRTNNVFEFVSEIFGIFGILGIVIFLIGISPLLIGIIIELSLKFVKR